MSDSALAIEQRGVRRLAVISDYITLTKPRISALVLVVVAVAAFVAGGGDCTGWPLVHALLGTLLVAGSASAVNQIIECRSDSLMARTASRPIPAGRLSTFAVVMFAIVTVTVGTVYLAFAVDIAAAGWALATWLLYVALYTPLKMRTSHNTAIGAISGALPVMIGLSIADTAWTTSLTVTGLALFLVLFLWQFPHFMAIAWIYRKQYGDAGIKMMTVVEPTGVRAGWYAVVGAVLLMPVSWAPALFTPWSDSIVYLVVATLLGIIQLRFAIRFLRSRNDQTARVLLRTTLLYLPLLLAAIVCHTI